MHKERFYEIDMLRGLSILVMIAIHATSYFLSDKIAYLVWDYSQFAVPVFIFCSAYLFFKKYLSVHFQFDSHYLISRLKRLVAPYYYYLAVLFVIMFFAGSLPPLTSLLRQITLITQTNDPSWLVLLFVELTLVMPMILYLWKKNKSCFWVYTLLVALMSMCSMFYRTHLHFKLIMWFMWSVVVVAALIFVQIEKQKKLVGYFTLLWGTLFVFTRFLLQFVGGSVAQYDNKYPPNLYHISYGLFCVGTLYFLSYWGVFEKLKLTRPLSFLSRYSYSIYFIHFFLIYVGLTFFKQTIYAVGWPLYFGVLLSVTVVIQYLLNRLVNKSQFQSSNVKTNLKFK